MYQPASFRTRDSRLVRDLLKDYPFATLLTDEGREINHLPLLLREDMPDQIVLEGHVALGNPVARAKNGASATAIFSGPHAYVSPNWYVSPGQVPTWNYAVVHARGRLAFLSDPEEVLEAMSRLVHRFEGPDGWSIAELPIGERERMLAAIRYFRIEVESVDAKIKMNQNRAPSDRDAVEARLATSQDHRHREMLEYFRRANAPT